MTDNTETLYNALDKIKELEKEKCELLGLLQAKDKLIEKMKCCGNCKYEPVYDERGNCLIAEECRICLCKSNWELAE